MNSPTLCLLGEYAAINLAFILKVEPAGGGGVNSNSLEPASDTAVEFMGLMTAVEVVAAPPSW